MPERIEIVILGAGTAGNAAARALARAGRKVLVAEPDRVGGTCLWRGCMPKKALYHAAAVVRGAGRAAQFGVNVGTPAVDWPAVLAWKWHAQETYAGDQDGILASLGIERVKASARFLSPDTLDIGGRQIQAQHIIVATGAVPRALSVPGAELADTSDAALRYQELPASLCIVGAGYIALEFAGIYASFGTRVTILDRSETVLAAFDRDCVALARTALEGLGVTFITDATLTALSGERGGLTLSYEADGETRTLKADRVLAAIGRQPALDGLGLEAAGIDLDDRGRAVLDPALRSSNDRVFFAGDAASREQHTPIASIHGRSVARTILEGTSVVPYTGGTPFACFTVPELAQSGLTEEAARGAGIPIESHSATFEYLGAAIISDVRHGLVKIIAEKETGIVIGGHIAGERASDLIYPIALAVRGGMTLEQLQNSAAVHPAFSESVNWAAF